MRLTHFALALTLILLVITGYLAWEGQQAARGAREELAFVKQQQAAQESARPGPGSQVLLPTAPAATITPPPPVPAQAAPAADALPPMAGASLPGGGLTIPKTVQEAESKGINTNTLTVVQKRVLEAKSVAKVKTVVKEQGFVILDAGSKQGLAKGQKYEIRRDNAVLAKIIIADTVEENEAVADLDLTSIPTGVVIEPGDEAIEPVDR